MKKVINHIRKKPEHKRDQYVWIIAGLATALLLIIWMIVGNAKKFKIDGSFFERFNQEVNQSKNTFDGNLLKP